MTPKQNHRDEIERMMLDCKRRLNEATASKVKTDTNPSKPCKIADSFIMVSNFHVNPRKGLMHL